MKLAEKEYALGIFRTSDSSRMLKRFGIEILERRLLLNYDAFVNDRDADDPGPYDSSHNIQSESATLVYAPTGTAVPVVVTAFNDFGSDTSITPKHLTGYARSTDAGISFTDGGALPLASGAPGDGGDPVLARDSASGIIYLATLAPQHQGPIQIFRSFDGGATFPLPSGTDTFTQPLRAFADRSDTAMDKDWIAVDNYPGQGQGNLYVVAGEQADTDFGVKFTMSSDAARLDQTPTFTFRMTLSSTGTGIGQGGPNVVVGPDHAIYVSYLETVVTGTEEYTVHSQVRQFRAIFSIPVRDRTTSKYER